MPNYADQQVFMQVNELPNYAVTLHVHLCFLPQAKSVCC